MENGWLEGLQKRIRDLPSGTLTMLPGTFVRQTLTSLCALFWMASPAQASRVTLQQVIDDDLRAASISNRDRVQIAKFVIDVNNSVTRDGAMVIYSYVDESRGETVELAKKRAESVSEYLRVLGVCEGRIKADFSRWTKEIPPSQRYQILLEAVPGREPCE